VRTASDFCTPGMRNGAGFAQHAFAA